MRIVKLQVCILAFTSMVLTTTVSAQTDPRPNRVTDPVRLSLAAGYKATFTCSSHFNAGRTIKQINGDELHRIYPDYREAFAQLPEAVVDADAKTVRVTYSEDYPPRLSSWSPKLGCIQSPAGSTEPVNFGSLEATYHLDKHSGTDAITLEANDTNLRQKQIDQSWPQGDLRADNDFSQSEAGSALRKQVDKAFDRNTYGEGTETTAVLVVKGGTIVAEKYRDGFDMHTPQRTWSVAKSIAASLIGAAIEQGYIDLMDKADLEHWSTPNDPRNQITLENFLHMASGLDNGPRGNRTDDIYFGGGRVVDHAQTRRLIVTPGTRWYYANNDTMLAMRLLREKVNNDAVFWDFPFKEVLHKIGMHHTFLETDWNGDFILSSQVYTTARDLARLGLLYLNKGVWEHQRIFPEWWSDYVVMPAPVQPPLRRDGTRRFGYGAQFWLLGGFSGLPEDAYAALGNRGQHLVIIPSQDLIIVRRGFDDNGGNQFNIADFASDVVKSME